LKDSKLDLKKLNAAKPIKAAKDAELKALAERVAKLEKAAGK